MIGAYLFCAVLGMSYLGISALIGELGDGGLGHAHAGSFGHHGEQGVHLPYFSPMAVAAYCTGFGSAGLILTRGLHIANPLIHVPASLAFGGLFGVGILLMMAKIAQHTETNSMSSLAEVVGTVVEVTIAIPAKGTGEVAFVSGGTRQTVLAEAEADQTFKQGARVRVTRAVDGVLYVTLAPSPSLASASPVLGEPLDAPPAPKPSQKIR